MIGDRIRIGWACTFCGRVIYGVNDPKRRIGEHYLCDDCEESVPVGALFLKTRAERAAWLRDRARQQFDYAERLAAIDPRPASERPVMEQAIDLGMLYHALADSHEARA